MVRVVRGSASGFLDLAGTEGVHRREVVVRTDRNEDLLVALLDDVVYRLDAGARCRSAWN
ncbi:hypothetical protein ABZ621_33935 [Streptomyces sp. NPDC007863]|uniref:hypothetical protein n=1 Tax=Streptomyces sp. NPDC007863 TaxID=3154894 RepID=UPI0033EBC55E